MTIKQTAERLTILKTQLEALEERYEIEAEKMKSKMKAENLKEYLHNGFKMEFGERENKSVNKQIYKSLVTAEEYEDSIDIKVSAVTKNVPERLRKSCFIYKDPTEYFKVSRTKKAIKEVAKQVTEELEVIRQAPKNKNKKSVEVV